MKYMHGSDFLANFSSIVQVPSLTEKVQESFGTDFKELFTDDSLKISCRTSLILNK